MNRRIFMAAAAATLAGALPVGAKERESGWVFIGRTEITGATSWEVKLVPGRSEHRVVVIDGVPYVEIWGDPALRGKGLISTTVQYS